MSGQKPASMMAVGKVLGIEQDGERGITLTLRIYGKLARPEDPTPMPNAIAEYESMPGRGVESVVRNPVNPDCYFSPRLAYIGGLERALELMDAAHLLDIGNVADARHAIKTLAELLGDRNQLKLEKAAEIETQLREIERVEGERMTPADRLIGLGIAALSGVLVASIFWAWLTA